jgi:hypothetical protein
MGITWLLNMESKLSITTSHTNGYLASTTIPIHTLEQWGCGASLGGPKTGKRKTLYEFFDVRFDKYGRYW